MNPWIGTYLNTTQNVNESIRQNADGSLSAVDQTGIPVSATISGNTITAWGLTGTRDPVTGNIVFSNGQTLVPLVAPTVASPVAVAAAVTTPTDFFSGTTFGVSNLVLVGIAVVGILFMSGGGGRR
jgi:hypothetical protein